MTMRPGRRGASVAMATSENSLSRAGRLLGTYGSYVNQSAAGVQLHGLADATPTSGKTCEDHGGERSMAVLVLMAV